MKWFHILSSPPSKSYKTAYFLLSVCLFLAALYSSSATAQQSFNLAKSQFIINISKLINWPNDHINSSPNTFNICIIGDDQDLFSELKKHSKETIHGLNIQFFLYHDESLLNSCHTLFIGHSEKLILSSITQITENNAILTISDIPSFTKKYGMFELHKINNNLAFKANLACIKKANLTANSNLLTLATNKKTILEERCQ